MSCFASTWSSTVTTSPRLPTDSQRSTSSFNLELDGHHVTEAADGQSALDELGRLHHDVLLLDMMMPGITGAEVLRVLSAQSTRPCGCVIAFAASPAHLDLATDLGADAAVLKSGDLQPVLTAMDTCPRQ